MENLNAEQVKKALECCTSGNSVSACMSGCPLYEKEDCECINDDTALLKYALALINSQEQRIKELTEENERLREHNIILEQKLMLLEIDDVYVFKAKVKGE